MSQVEHELRILSPIGDLLDIITDGYFAGLTYTLKENEPGVLDLVLPGDYDKTKLKIDGQIEIRRAVSGGSLVLEGDTAFFLRKPQKFISDNGVSIIPVQAFSALDLAKRRIVAYFAGTSFTEKEKIPWDDMLREIMDENFGPGASYAGPSYSGPYLDGDADRNLEPWLTVEEDRHWGTAVSWGASYTRSMAWDNILSILQDIVNDVRSQGVYCTFDVIRTAISEFEFRVFIGPRGADHTADSALPVIVSEERGNLLKPSWEDDWTEEKNFIYSTGQGQEDERVVKTAQDDARIGISPFNRQEFLHDARASSLEDSVQAEANTALESHRPRRIFTGFIAQTEGCLYGVHWNWGDIVTAEYDGHSYDCHVTAVTVTVNQDGTEIVEGQLRSDSDVA